MQPGITLPISSKQKLRSKPIRQISGHRWQIRGFSSSGRAERVKRCTDSLRLPPGGEPVTNPGLGFLAFHLFLVLPGVGFR
jgi:hypothetical protein